MRTFAILLLIGTASTTLAAEQNAIDRAVKAGGAFLAERYRNLKPGGEAGDGIGPPALAGLALLETGRRADDPAVNAIAAAVREACYAEIRTYQLSLCLIFLDRLGQRSDEPLIQLLAIRLLAGQNANGGWTYNCIDTLPAAEEQRLRARLGVNQLVAGERGPGAAAPKEPNKNAKDGPGLPRAAGRLHPEVERHLQGLLANEARGRLKLPDDNSNTQFAILAVWVAKKHGVNVEAAMAAIEKRFLASQTPTGGWPYSGLLPAEGSPSMTCAGLLGLATAVGRREERRLKAEGPRKPVAPKVEPKANPDDPFFKPAPPPPVVKPVPKLAPDVRDKAIERGLENLAGVLRGEAVARGRNPFRGRGELGDKDLYFLWSLERVGVVYGLPKIGKQDWYQLGSDMLIPTQKRDGSWGDGGYAVEVDTAFALLFLARSNLVRDLSAKVQRDPMNSELRGGPSLLDAEPAPAASVPMTDSKPTTDPKAKPVVVVPSPVAGPTTPKPKLIPSGEAAAKLAEALLKVPDAAWTQALKQVRDGKGGDFTAALAVAIHRCEGDRKRDTRSALAERLTRMSAETLRGLLASDDVELRRAAVLACAMRDDKNHIPDLIERIAADEETVVRAARAGLKSLSGGQDFGPEPGFSRLDRAVAVEEWKAWWGRQKK